MTLARVRATAALRTYRCLRLSLVVLVATLLFSVWLERLAGSEINRNLGSISAYFYTPARSVFVGTLVALGIGLVVISGRRGFENSALTVAGMLAPIVAFVPTPLGVEGGPCVEGSRCTVPSEYVPAVVNNVYSLIVLGAIGLIWGIRTICSRSATRSCRIGLAASLLVWSGFVAWFMVGRDSFLDGAHFAAAVPLFGLMTAVAFVNARRAPQRRTDVPFRETGSYTAIYGVVAVGMTLALAAGGAFALVDRLGLPGAPHEWVLWVEVALLVSFAAFWVTQTVDYWEDGVPEEAASISEGPYQVSSRPLTSSVGVRVNASGPSSTVKT